jgi:E3 ubiquitin-protein ligase ZNF598
MVEEHGAAMSSQDRRNAMRIQADFTFEDVGVGGARGGRGGRGGGGGGRPNEREPPPIASAPSRGGGTAGGNRRREGFGTHLTSGDTPTPSPRAPSPVDGSRGDVDPTVAERHDAFMARLQSLAPNPQNATIIVKSSVRSYRARESAARDLISSFWNVLGEDLDNTATLISMLVDLLDDEEQKSNLLAAWNGFKVEVGILPPHNSSPSTHLSTATKTIP